MDAAERGIVTVQVRPGTGKCKVLERYHAKSVCCLMIHSEMIEFSGCYG